MKRSFRLLAALGAAVLTVAAAPAAKWVPGNWNAAVALTPAGTHVLGNPAAKVKLVEFVSYTCPHCAAFHQESEATMRLEFVARGQVSVEIRSILRDPVDATVALLTNCGPKEKFLLNHSLFLRNQSRWIGPLVTAGEAQRNRWYTGDRAARSRAIAADFHFYDLMATRGYDRTAVDRCLADNAMAERLARISAEAGQLGVDHTPSFSLDGLLLTGTSEWSLLEPQIRARL